MIPKLVRDKIPDIIKNSGHKYDIEILSDELYIKALDAKLIEELTEYYESHNLEELADLLEVIYAATNALGYTVEDLEAIRVVKAHERGKFDKRIFLKKIYERKEKKDE